MHTLKVLPLCRSVIFIFTSPNHNKRSVCMTINHTLIAAKTFYLKHCKHAAASKNINTPYRFFHVRSCQVTEDKSSAQKVDLVSIYIRKMFNMLGTVLYSIASQTSVSNFELIDLTLQIHEIFKEPLLLPTVQLNL